MPVSLFTFRSVQATSSGAKSLFIPTPFAIRTALLDAAIRTKGIQIGELAFNLIKGIPIAVLPPEQVVVTNLFSKILKPTREKNANSALVRTIAFREFAYLSGNMLLAFQIEDEQAFEISLLLNQINYFGKRGSFFQFFKQTMVNELPSNFVLLDGPFIEDKKTNGTWPHIFKVGIIQIMDDWGNDLTFEKVNVFSDEKIRVGSDRIRKSIILPYCLVRSSKSFSYYERI